MRAPSSRLLALALPTFALSACSMAPAYRVPTTVAIPSQFKEEPGWAAASPSDAVARGAWWDLFRDPVLDDLERRVEVTNQNVASYRAAYMAARGLVQVQRSALFPTLDLSASGTHSKTFEGQTVSGGTGATTTATGAAVSRYSLSIGASWEPDLWGRLGNTLSQAKASAQASAGDLAVSVEPDLPPVNGDAAQLSQLLHNLIDNAMKYGAAGTPVTVELAAEDGLARLTVADRGEGIAREHVPRLTERFYRAEPSRSRSLGGTGLGLAIVKHIVERHRGRLDIVSTLGQGTTVTVLLPLSSA